MGQRAGCSADCRRCSGMATATIVRAERAQGPSGGMGLRRRAGQRPGGAADLDRCRAGPDRADRPGSVPGPCRPQRLGRGHRGARVGVRRLGHGPAGTSSWTTWSCWRGRRRTFRRGSGGTDRPGRGVAGRAVSGRPGPAGRQPPGQGRVRLHRRRSVHGRLSPLGAAGAPSGGAGHVPDPDRGPGAHVWAAVLGTHAGALPAVST
jgi:hypothetical protein